MASVEPRPTNPVAAGRAELLHSGGLPGVFGHPDVASLVGLTAG